MKPIRQLDSQLINKIAAGEVVERPLSVVKELVENAVDAGASVITVEIQNGGLAQIRVTDNGSGIPSEELPLAFAQHATSKIENADDLFHIVTLGFRGEALSSIAAVSQVELITKTISQTIGARILLQAGNETSRTDIGCADGTTVIVSNLFYNTPARLKFLKKPAVEAGHISDMMQRLALGNPGVSFRYINNGKPALQTNGGGDCKAVLHNLYGRDISSKLLEIQAESSGVTLTGYIGKPETARGNRSYGHFFINGRYVKCPLLQQAVESGMKTLLPGGRFPVYALYLQMPPGEVDVNVHPNKLDVRFEDEEAVSLFVSHAVSQAMATHNLIPEVTLSVKRPILSEPTPFDTLSLPLPHPSQLSEPYKLSEPFIPSESHMPVLLPRRSEDSRETATPHTNASCADNSRNDHSNQAIPYEVADDHTIKTPRTTGSHVSAPTPISVQDSNPHDRRLVFNEEPIPEPTVRPFFHEYTILGLLFKTYWLVAQGESLYVIDQHAAHERVLFEEITTLVNSGQVPVQPLLEPVTLRLTPREKQTLREHAGLFERFGFEIAADQDPVTLNALPVLFKSPADTSFFTEILDSLENAGTDSLYDYKFNKLAMTACKSAVKANDALSETEARALIIRMLSLRNPFTCPHGRPTIIEITKHELERKFKRV